MEKKINIAELLKDCPKGMELYSPLFGDCKFVKVHDYEAEIIVELETGATVPFLTDGRYYDYPNAECILFPKGKTTWEGFVPFVAGDVIYTDNFIAILSNIEESGTVWYHCYYCIDTKKFKAKRDFGIGNINHDEFRLATEEEKEKLFNAIKANGYSWNAETKTLDKLPKFKVGDKITDRNKFIYRITEITDKGYKLHDLKTTFITFEEADLYFVKVVDVFDITTLKPFEKVLVRDKDTQEWVISLFSHCHELGIYTYTCINGNRYAQCIPYEVNKELLGTTDDCDEFYKTWE